MCQPAPEGSSLFLSFLFISVVSKDDYQQSLSQGIAIRLPNFSGNGTLENFQVGGDKGIRRKANFTVCMSDVKLTKLKA